jgi:Methionine biosynthesis protein MetW.
VTGKVAVGYIFDTSAGTHSFRVSLDAARDYDVRHDSLIRRILTERFDLAAGIGNMRNRLVSNFLACDDVEWLWSIDADMGFVPDALYRLLESADPQSRPFVGGLCFGAPKTAPDGMGGFRWHMVPTIFDVEPDEKGVPWFRADLDYPRDALVECDGTGGAFTLIHRSAFERISAAVMPGTTEPVGSRWYTCLDDPTGAPLGEDLSFCLRAKQVGIPVLVDTRVKTSHAKTVHLSEADYDRNRPEPAPEPEPEPSPLAVDLVVVVPTRERPASARDLAEAFRQTCTASTALLFAVDDNDPELGEYRALAGGNVFVIDSPSRNMGEALRAGVAMALGGSLEPFAVGFMGDDHRPRTKGWDAAYLDALRDLGTGIVYGNDLLQGERLPTQCAMTADIVRILGFMAPEKLVHLYFDDFWLRLGTAANCLRYLSDVVVEHVHPFAGKAPMDAGYERVNAQGMYDRDRASFEEYLCTRFGHDVDRVRMIVPPREWGPFSADVSTLDFHRDRERAPHLEQAAHRPRLLAAAKAIRELGDGLTVSDLGCGDGGLLSLLDGMDAHGYDFQPANAAGWAERGVKAEALDVFGEDWHRVRFGDVSVLTEVLEHLADPHGVLKRLPSRFVVASSPRIETGQRHAEEHAWAWNEPGYARLFADAGWKVLRHDMLGWSQLIVAEREA